jgi:hypothetical protein
MENDSVPKGKNCSDDEELIKINKISMSPSAINLSPNRPYDKNYAETSFNEISAINNTTIGPDTSMNTTQLDLIRKLHQTAVGNPQKVDNFDTQSNASYFFNEEELANHEEHIQQKINDIWNETQVKQEKV